jgi:hypothetical protein
MIKTMKVPLQKYMTTLLIVVIHVLILALVTKYYLPSFHLSNIFYLGAAFIAFKWIQYLLVSIKIKDNSFIYNGVLKRGQEYSFSSISEIELEGPSQFNSNYMLALYGEQKLGSDKRVLLKKIPIYWFSRKEMVLLLNTIRESNPFVQLQKQVNSYLFGEYWKTLVVNYTIQYVLLLAIIIFIINKYN